MKRTISTVSIVFLFVLPVSAQSPPVNGMREADVRTHAITNATVIPSPGRRIEDGVIIIRNGVIADVGRSEQIKIPVEAVEWDATGKTIYPGLIEPALMIEPAKVPSSAGSHWNHRVHPELNMSELPPPDDELRETLRSLGFTAAAVYPSTGAWRGTGVVIALAKDEEDVLAYRDRGHMACGFDYGGSGSWENEKYPGALTGAIALLRQTLYDSQWHAACRRVWKDYPEGNEPPIRADALVALNDVVTKEQTVLFEVTNDLNAVRAARIGREFDLSMQLLGSGLEFRRLNEVVELNLPILVPLSFPEEPDVSTISKADRVSLRDLMTWEQAPTNARRLIEAGVTIALTTHKLEKHKDFYKNLREAIKHGLSEDDALAALTTTPAELLGLDHVLGTIAVGKAANLVVVKGTLFEKKAKVYETWINGQRFEVEKDPEVQLSGKGTLTIDGDELAVEINTKKNRVKVTYGDNKKSIAKKVVVQKDQISFVVDGKVLDSDGFIRFSGVMRGPPVNSVRGKGILPDGSTFEFTITITEPKDDDGDEDEDDEEEREPDAISGVWSLLVDEFPVSDVELRLKLKDDNSVTGSLTMMDDEMEVEGGTFDPEHGTLELSFISPDGETVAVIATVQEDVMTGTAESDVTDYVFSGQRTTDDDEKKFIPPPEELVVPLGEYGLDTLPEPESVLITNATIWTCGPDGILEDAELVIEDGKIEYVGKTLARTLPGDVRVIDAAGKHVTPGLVDCHSHTGIDSGINEWTQTNTAEVRMEDVIDPDDVNWYRQLAGGLTVANQLHGSANPIGGQNSVVKLKWGGSADDFHFADAKPGIKFALGENVKRSQNRYPNTRMGVETFIRDAFTAARDYTEEWDRYLALSEDEKLRTMPPQRDLELDTMTEILNSDRLIHCHSYRQDEILMLMRLAESFGFTIGTFQHILEGYKVAEVMAEHGAAGSSFSDWWAYKVEVMDAIPYNGALMHKVGVNVSFNSDSDELARRMNTEASKAVRYGDLSPEDALNFVTINPAYQLRVDHRCGSLEEGRDADFVIWSGDPLSTYSRCEQTWIEGACYFSLEMDQHHRERIKVERERIIQKILAKSHSTKRKKNVETSKRRNVERCEESTHSHFFYESGCDH